MISITYKYQKMLFEKTHQKIFSLFSQKKNQKQRKKFISKNHKIIELIYPIFSGNQKTS